ncbi:MAG: hypothetical protein GY821_09905 [Gammaproteobacteria bacterium]|nr:hypothetical protein [Gammaproteobacteria bacterium]
MQSKKFFGTKNSVMQEAMAYNAMVTINGYCRDNDADYKHIPMVIHCLIHNYYEAQSLSPYRLASIGQKYGREAEIKEHCIMVTVAGYCRENNMPMPVVLYAVVGLYYEPESLSPYPLVPTVVYSESNYELFISDKPSLAINDVNAILRKNKARVHSMGSWGTSHTIGGFFKPKNIKKYLGRDFDLIMLSPARRRNANRDRVYIDKKNKKIFDSPEQALKAATAKGQRKHFYINNWMVLLPPRLKQVKSQQELPAQPVATNSGPCIGSVILSV